MIESTRAKTAEMALRLSAVNKWCVTGKQHICKHFLIKKVFSNLYGSFAKVISVYKKSISLKIFERVLHRITVRGHQS